VRGCPGDDGGGDGSGGDGFEGRGAANCLRAGGVRLEVSGDHFGRGATPGARALVLVGGRP
jgi:hypothetical protein